MAFSVILGEKPKLVISLQFVGLSDVKIIIREKLAYSREHKNAREFWDVVNRNI